MEDYSTPSQRSKVTLSNWVRLNNAPLPLTRASAVQWNNFVFVLASDDTALFYHSKRNMWSMQPKPPYNCLNLTPALTLHNGQIFTMSLIGEVSTFNPQLCRWTALNDMRMSDRVGNRPRLIVSDNNNLYSVVDFKTQVQGLGGQGLGGQDLGLPLVREARGARKARGQYPQYPGGIQQPSPQQQALPNNDCSVFSYNSSSKWEKICEFGSSPLKFAAVADGTLFVHAGEEMFKLSLPVNPKLEGNTKLPPPTTPASGTGLATPSQNTPRNPPAPQPLLQSAIACASPMYAGSTLHAIKDTLFSFGGRDEDNQPASDVLRYNPDTDTWESAGYMRSARYNVAVATVQDTTLDVVVLGGSLGSSEHMMPLQVHPPSVPVVQAAGGLYVAPPAWDNKTSIIEKCTVN